MLLCKSSKKGKTDNFSLLVFFEQDGIRQSLILNQALPDYEKVRK